jgi:signal transduction histidine kinase
VTALAPESVLLVSLPAEWLDRLVGVLVDNACRHARTAVRVEARAIEEGRAEFSVSDDGEGIPEAELPLLFHRFHRGTSTGEGAGLGLAIADSIVRATQGRWRVTNLAGGGARFAVVWPLGRGASSSPAELPATTPGPPAAL